MSKIILVVEDEEALREALRDKLGREGFTVLEAKNGEDGLRVAEEHHPDVILLDIIMPKMDGVTMLQKVRESDWGKVVRVIVLSNLADDEHAQAAAAKWNAEYLVKSNWKLEALIEKIHSTLA
jgi:two-component system, OmpR family, alkaline phosphatase synthesis response regulator PhoP